MGVFGRPCLGAGGQDGSVALAQLYLVDHGMFIFFTPFSLQKIPAFSRPFFFFFLSFFFPPHFSRQKNNPKIIQRVFEGWKEPKQFGQPSCLDTYSNQMFISLVSLWGEKGALQAHFECPQLWKRRDGGSDTSFSSVCFSFPFFGSCVSWLGAERAFSLGNCPAGFMSLAKG